MDVFSEVGTGKIRLKSFRIALFYKKNAKKREYFFGITNKLSIFGDCVMIHTNREIYQRMNFQFCIDNNKSSCNKLKTI